MVNRLEQSLAYEARASRRYLWWTLDFQLLYGTSLPGGRDRFSSYQCGRKSRRNSGKQAAVLFHGRWTSHLMNPGIISITSISRLRGTRSSSNWTKHANTIESTDVHSSLFPRSSWCWWPFQVKFPYSTRILLQFNPDRRGLDGPMAAGDQRQMDFLERC